MTETLTRNLDDTLAKFTNPFDRMEYLLGLTHFSYDEGAAAYYRMTKLFPELLAEYRKVSAEATDLRNGFRKLEGIV